MTNNELVCELQIWAKDGIEVLRKLGWINHSRKLQTLVNPKYLKNPVDRLGRLRDWAHKENIVDKLWRDGYYTLAEELAAIISLSMKNLPQTDTYKEC